MTNDLIINGKDAFSTWGVSMGDGFLESLLTPPPMKDVIENKSRLENGKEILLNNRKVDERDLTLVFTIEGNTAAEYISRYKDFLDQISQGEVQINVPMLGQEVYHVYYLRSSAYAMNTNRTFCMLSVKFNEPNPANRT